MGSGHLIFFNGSNHNRVGRRTKIKEKNFSPSLFALSNNNWEKVSYKISTNICQVLGIKKN